MFFNSSSTIDFARFSNSSMFMIWLLDSIVY
jgi:hypothetical protein